MLAYISGSVNEELLRRIEYLMEENRVLRNRIEKRILLTDPERRSLAEKAVALGTLMADTVTIAKPETILKWHRRLVAKKFDGSKARRYPGRPRIRPEIEALVVKLARENPAWGYDRIAGALRNLGHPLADQTARPAVALAKADGQHPGVARPAAQRPDSGVIHPRRAARPTDCAPAGGQRAELRSWPRPSRFGDSNRELPPTTNSHRTCPSQRLMYRDEFFGHTGFGTSRHELAPNDPLQEWLPR